MTIYIYIICKVFFTHYMFIYPSLPNYTLPFRTIKIITRRSQNLPLRPIVFRLGGGPRVVVSTAAFHARVRGSVPGLGGFKETKMFLPHPRVKVSIVGSLRDREVACSASDRQGSNFESCVWRTVSSQSSHHPQEVLLAQFSLYVHKGGLKPDLFHFLVFRLFNKFTCVNLPESKPPSRNIPPFLTPICDHPRIYPSLPEYFLVLGASGRFSHIYI